MQTMSEITLSELKRKDYRTAIKFAIEEMHYNM